MFVLHIWSYIISYINAHDYANVLLDCMFYEYITTKNKYYIFQPTLQLDVDM